MIANAPAVAAVLGVLMAGCGTPSSRPDDAPGDAFVGCGDGIIDESSERCDDGAATGTSTSLCRHDCLSGQVRWYPQGPHVTLPFAARKLVYTGGALVIHDGEQLAAVWLNGSEPLLLANRGAQDFEVGGHGDLRGNYVMWLERSDPPSSWSVRAVDLGEYPAPVVRALDLPGGTRGPARFIQYDNIGIFGIAYVDLEGQLRIATVHTFEPPQMLSVDLGVAPAGTLAVARMLMRAPARVATFFTSESSTEVIVSGHPEDGPTPTMHHRGTFPWRVIDASEGSWESERPPDTIAMLTPDGSILIAELRDDTGEASPRLYGKVPAGTQRIDGNNAFWTATADGNIVYLGNNARGQALAPQAFAVGTPCMTCTVAESSGVPDWFAFDRIAVPGVAVP